MVIATSGLSTDTPTESVTMHLYLHATWGKIVPSWLEDILLTRNDVVGLVGADTLSAGDEKLANV